MAVDLAPTPQLAETEEIRDSQQTTCCVVGGGPGGMRLALLLARRGVPVTLLEQHKDFDREFRGDTIHPSILEILHQVGLAEPLHQLRHMKNVRLIHLGHFGNPSGLHRLRAWG
jgi:2-polyprenyl-6-methoxyphenol hydroxylase-like FAD-dependent oxidoreductase